VQLLPDDIGAFADQQIRSRVTTQLERLLAPASLITHFTTMLASMTYSVTSRHGFRTSASRWACARPAVNARNSAARSSKPGSVSWDSA
jgi:hypothetical protein